MVSVHSRVYPRIGLARFCEAGRRPCANTISDHQNSHPSSCCLRDTGSFSPSPVRNCTSLVHPVRDYMHLNEDRTCSGPRHTETMKSTRHTSSRRIQRRNEQEQRVLAGEPPLPRSIGDALYASSGIVTSVGGTSFICDTARRSKLSGLHSRKGGEPRPLSHPPIVSARALPQI